MRTSKQTFIPSITNHPITLPIEQIKHYFGERYYAITRSSYGYLSPCNFKLLLKNEFSKKYPQYASQYHQILELFTITSVTAEEETIGHLNHSHRISSFIITLPVSQPNREVTRHFNYVESYLRVPTTDDEKLRIENICRLLYKIKGSQQFSYIKSMTQTQRLEFLIRWENNITVSTSKFEKVSRNAFGYSILKNMAKKCKKIAPMNGETPLTPKLKQ